jgi:glycosyltransferase involved in cell wall biosynthesis
MHIAVLYQHYNTPDCAATGGHHTLISEWSRRHDITLIASRAWYEQRLTQRFDWAPPGVRVHLLDVPYDNAMTPGQRLWAFGRFAGETLLRGLTIDRPDVIFGVTTPLTTALIASLISSLRDIPWVFHLKDLWPDFPIQMGAVRSPWMQRALYGLERHLYHHAAHVVALSPDMAAHVRRRGVPPKRVSTLVNGTDFYLIDACTSDEVRTLQKQHGLQDKRVVLYAGTYGRANDIPTVLTAAERLDDRADVRFVFIGDGYEAPRVRAAARHRSNVLALPPQPRHRMFGWFKLADVSLVPFIDLPVLAANSPAKFYDSLGAGTPVVVTNPGWTKRFVEQHRCGWYVPPSSPDVLTQRLNALLNHPDALQEAGRRGAAVAREQFDRVQLARRLEAILARVVTP